MTLLMRQILIAALAAAGLVSIAARAATLNGSGHPASETRELGGFQAIALHDSIDLVVRQSAREGVQLRGDDNLLSLVQTVVEGDDRKTLHIRLRPGISVQRRTPLVVTVDVLRLTALASRGSGDIDIEPLKTPAFALTIEGSSDARLRQLEAEKFNVSIAGSGDVWAHGRVARFDVAIAGSGDVHARELAAGDVSISISGSGDVSVTAHKTLGVSIAGSGDVDYGGGATLEQLSVAGSGTLRRRAP